MTNNPARSGAWINPDSRTVLLIVVSVTSVLATVSFAVSFAGLVAVAQWAAIPSWLAWALPVFIDGAIIVYTLAMLVFRARGASTVFAWSALLAFTGVSVAANAAHAYAAGDPSDWRTWVGAALAGLAPAGVAVATHTLAGLTVQPPATRVEPVDVAPTDVPVQAGAVTPATSFEGAPVASPPVEQPVPALEPPVAPAPAVSPPSPRVNVGGEGDLADREGTTRRILDLRDAGRSHQEIADAVGLSKSTVGRLLREHRETHRLRAIG